jgi:transposase
MDISEEVDGDIVQRFGEVMRLAREHLSASERLRIVEESFAGKMSVQDVARRNGVSRGQLNEWRRALRDSVPAAVGWKRFSAKRAAADPDHPQFVAVKVAARNGSAPAAAPVAAHAVRHASKPTSKVAERLDKPIAAEPAPTAPLVVSQIEIICCSGRRVLVGADVDAAALARVMDVLER